MLAGAPGVGASELGEFGIGTLGLGEALEPGEAGIAVLELVVPGAGTLGVGEPAAGELTPDEVDG